MLDLSYQLCSWRVFHGTVCSEEETWDRLHWRHTACTPLKQRVQHWSTMQAIHDNEKSTKKKKQLWRKQFYQTCLTTFYCFLFYCKDLCTCLKSGTGNSSSSLVKNAQTTVSSAASKSAPYSTGSTFCQTETVKPGGPSRFVATSVATIDYFHCDYSITFRILICIHQQTNHRHNLWK